VKICSPQSVSAVCWCRGKRIVTHFQKYGFNSGLYPSSQATQRFWDFIRLHLQVEWIDGRTYFGGLRPGKRPTVSDGSVTVGSPLSPRGRRHIRPEKRCVVLQFSLREWTVLTVSVATVPSSESFEVEWCIMYFCVEYNFVKGVENKTHGCIVCSYKALHVKPCGMLRCWIRKCHREAHGRLVGQEILYGVCNPTIPVPIDKGLSLHFYPEERGSRLLLSFSTHLHIVTSQLTMIFIFTAWNN